MITFGQAANLLDVPKACLRELIGHNLLAAELDHNTWYLDEKSLPSRKTVSRQIRELHQQALENAIAATREVDVEIEAIRLDCHEALDHPGVHPLGEYVEAATTQGSLHGALVRLRMRTVEVMLLDKLTFELGPS